MTYLFAEGWGVEDDPYYPPDPHNPAIFEGNGCGTNWTDIFVPDRPLGIDLGPACNAHDQCYDTGSNVSRQVCDQRLAEDVRAACKAEGFNDTVCNTLATVYQAGVTLLGGPAYNGNVALVPMLEPVPEFFDFR